MSFFQRARIPWGQVGDAILLFSVALIARIVAFGKLHDQSPDEYFILVLARDFWRAWTGQASLAGMDTLHTAGFPLLLAILFFLCGEASIEAGKSLGLFFNTLTVPATYFLGRLCLPRARAFGAALLLAAFPAFFRDADRVWMDHPGAFFTTLYLTLALIAWRKGSLKWWSGASAALAMLAWTKEYLFVLALPVTLVGVAAHFRRHPRRFWLASLGIAFLGVGIIAWLQLASGWLPKASYLEAIVYGVPGERREYFGFSPVPNMRKLYYQNLYETELPAVFLVLGLTGLLRAALSWKDRPDLHAPLITIGSVPLFFALYFSILENLYGARLLFPAFPVAALAVSAGLWPDGRRLPVGLITCCGIIALFPGLDGWPPLSHYPPGWTASFLIAAAGIQAAGIFWRHRPDIQSLRLMIFVYGIALSLGWCGFHVRNFAALQAEADRQIGPQNGFLEAQEWTRRNIHPDDPVLTANPRKLSYYTGASSYRTASHAWWEKYFAQVEEDYLRKYRIRWIVITRPDFSERRAIQMYDALKSRPYLEEAYTLRKGQSIALSFFRVRSERERIGPRD